MPLKGPELNMAISPSAPRARASRSTPIASSAIASERGQ